MSEDVHERVRALMGQAVELVRATSFVKGYSASDEECAGLVLSKYLEWDGRIVTACHEALEDTNFSHVAEVLEPFLPKDEEKETQ